MDAKSHATLELPKILDRLAGHAHFSASKQLALELAPSADRSEIEGRLAETAEARALLEDQPELTIGGAHDVRASASDAARGLSLEPHQILEVADTLISARNHARRFDSSRDMLPRLAAVADEIEIPEGLIGRIQQVLDDRGEVLDQASEALASIRRKAKQAHDRLVAKMQAMVSDPKIAKLLQEPIVTQREGRYVLPLRAEFKGQLKSVVHDQSSSGATLFVEPLAAVELNNEVRELVLAEEEEIRRILAELSSWIGSERPALQATVEALAAIDLALAKARLAVEQRANAPTLAPAPKRAGDGSVQTSFRLLGARHPLLDPDEVVPIDLALDEDTRAVVITGPNTGGKTVALKTAGLLTLMANCGMQIPAEAGSQLATFAGVYADIGDEQSIEQSLSTFSGHITRIISILKLADEQSLVILDELGAGTDPQEGAALAMAILEQLLELGCTTLVATHYPELKHFAHLTEAVRNASVQFDLDSLRPTYHLVVGLPGKSNALTIAQRLGLDPRLIEQAKAKLTPGELQTEALLDEIHQQHSQGEQARESALAAQTEAEAHEQKLRQQLDNIEVERVEILEAAKEEAAGELAELRRQIKALRRELQAARKPLEALQAVESVAAGLEEQVETPVQPEKRPSDWIFETGDTVRLRGLGQTGVISELNEADAEIQVGKLRVRAHLDELEPAPTEADPGGQGTADTRRRRVSLPSAEPPPVELDLRGATVESALHSLERRLDAAFLAGSPQLRVIHGKGSGRLRQAVRDLLRESEYVAGFSPGGPRQGGEGVTIVELAVG